MTVSELIANLQNLDGNMEVGVADPRIDYVELRSISVENFYGTNLVILYPDT